MNKDNFTKLPKLKYYERPIENINNNFQFIDRNNNNNLNKNDYSNILLDRQLTNLTYGSDIEQQLNYPNICHDQNIHVNNLLLNENDYNELSKKYPNDCSKNKKDINWGDYYLFIGQKTTGRGFGNPDNYDKTYVGQDTRIQDTTRDIDLKDRNIIPIDSFRLNYGNIHYDDDNRGGISTRTYKKSGLTPSVGSPTRSEPTGDFSVGNSARGAAMASQSAEAGVV
jgi:hypothetical protein